MSYRAQHVSFEGTRNTRDFGGIKTIDGRVIKSHRILRSEYLHRISDKDKEDLKTYGLKSVIDLRGQNEYQAFPDQQIDGVNYYYYSLEVEPYLVNQQNYPHREFKLADKDLFSLVTFLFLRSPNGNSDEVQCTTYKTMPVSPSCISSWKNIFSLFLNQKDGAILFHCTDGKDRTGLTAVLLLSALGVDEDTILDDYLRTNEAFAERRNSRDKYLHEESDLDEDLIQSVLKVTGVAKEWYDAFMSSVKEHYGSMMKFLKGPIGLTDEDISSLRDNYLE